MTDSTGQETSTYPSTKGKRPAELERLYREAKAARRPLESDWFLSLAFTSGSQFYFWNRNRLDRIKDWRSLVVDNRMLPIITGRVARKVKNRPAFVATPRTGDEDDINAAEITEKIVEFDWNALELQQKLYQALLWADVAGAGFWKIYWDSTAGDETTVVVGPDGQPVTNQEGKLMRPEDFGGQPPMGMQAQQIRTGDVCVDVLSPFEFYPDPLAKSLDECEWVIEEKVRSVEYVKRRYKQELKADTDAPSGPIESRLFASMERGSSEYKGVKVLEYWARPSSEYPNGKRCVWSQDKFLAEDDQPFDPMPYVMFSGMRIPGRFWPTSMATQLRGPQSELNTIRTQIRLNAVRLGNLSLMRSKQANVQYSGVPGEDVLYDSTVPDPQPSFLAPPPIPAYVENEVQRITDAMTEISGLHEVSNAQVPAGVTAASAINLLQEADDTRLGPEIQDMERQLTIGGTKIAQLRAKYNTDERIIKLAGEDGDWDIFSFRGQMMGPAPDVECQAGSAMPRSKAAKQAAMLEVLQTMFQYGLVPDQRDLHAFFREYGVGALEKLFDSVTSDEQQVIREHRIMKQGVAVPINPWDDDQYHVSAHEDLQKSGLFSRLDPSIQNIINLHVQSHQERMKQAVDMQAQAAGYGANGQQQANPPNYSQLTTPAGGNAGLNIPG